MALANPRFDESFERVLGEHIADTDRDAFFDAFYRAFLTRPNVASLFADTDMSRQVSMLKRSLFDLVGYYVTGVPSAELYRLADVHRRLGVSDELFDDWLEALVDTVRKFDAHGNEATWLAWAWALTPGVTFMRLQLQALD